MNKVLLSLTLALMAGVSFADVQLLYPVEEVVRVGGSMEIALGEVSPGQSFQVRVSRDSVQSRDEWDTLRVDGLPGDWALSVSPVGVEPLTATITLPLDPAYRNESFTVSAVDTDGQIASQPVSVSVTVSRGLMNYSLEDASASINQGSSTSFTLRVLNESIAPDRVLIQSTLPVSWFIPMEVEVPAQGEKVVELSVSPLASGERPFKFRVQSILSEEYKDLDALVTARTTLEGAMSPTTQGPLVFPTPLAPFYYLMEWLSSFI